MTDDNPEESDDDWYAGCKLIRGDATIFEGMCYPHSSKENAFPILGERIYIKGTLYFDPPKRKCDCGGAKVNSTHSGWCSLNETTRS